MNQFSTIPLGRSFSIPKTLPPYVSKKYDNEDVFTSDPKTYVSQIKIPQKKWLNSKNKYTSSPPVNVAELAQLPQKPPMNTIVH